MAMRFKKYYFVYIVCNIHKTVLYVGITNDLQRRLREHADNKVSSFCTKYRCIYLVHSEKFDDVRIAINREKQIKKWGRKNKMRLIERINPGRDFLNDFIHRVDSAFL